MKFCADYQSGNVLYFIERDASGQVWYPAGQVFEVWGGGAGRDKADYGIAFTDKGGDHYVGTFDPNTPAGRHWVQGFLRLGASPADGDPLIGGGPVRWSGSVELTADKILLNKAVQTKSTGAVVYYDDDGSTPLITQTPSEDSTTVTRAPS